MTSEAAKQIKIWFENYVETIFPENLKSLPVIQLKLEHIRNVTVFCRTIGSELQWPETDIVTAEIIGLLHDVGRFSQFVEFGTFIDADSINHGERGYNIVRKSQAGAKHSIDKNTNIERKSFEYALPLLSSFPSHYRRIILDGIRHHNDKKFSRKVRPESLPFLKLIRDADKLDKLQAARLSVLSRKRDFEDPALKLSSDGPVNPYVIAQIRAKRTVSKKYIKTEIDFRLMQLSLVFEVYYKPTYKHIYTGNALRQIIDILPDDRKIQVAAESVLHFLDSHCE